jgi:uncharacterized protein (TIGR02646 family)
MVSLKRGEPPRILREKATEWGQRYLAEYSGEKRPRPRSDRYGHPEVLTELRRMSHGKCFYCERKLSEEEDEVDHYVEVEERRDLAFTWTNLYLSCEGCNKLKDTNQRLPVAECVDPCDGNQRPAAHLSFEDELIVALDDRGRQTIKKYQLDRDDLDLQRIRLLQKFNKIRNDIQARMIKDGRREPTDKERELLERYRDRARPFSLMMDVYLSHEGW